MKDPLKQELKKEFDGKSIDQLEKDAKKLTGDVRQIQTELIRRLYYLKFTKRFKESSGYKKMPWGVYVKDKFQMTEATFHSLKIAYLRFPQESKVLGPGVVTTVRRQCGAEKTNTVLSEIMNLKKRSPDKVEKIIGKNSLPKVKARKNQLSYNMLEKQLSEERQRVRELNALVAEKDEQIKKLKETVEQLRSFVPPAFSEGFDYSRSVAVGI